MSFIFSATSNLNDSKYGALEMPIKMLIEAESDLAQKKTGALTALFNIEKSTRYAEGIQYQDRFGGFTYAAEGSAAETDGFMDTYSKMFEHIPYMKEFVITKQMLDDSVIGIGVDAKRRVQNFVRAYYLTLNKAAEQAFANARKGNMIFNKANISLTTADNKPLFDTKHMYGCSITHVDGTQSNLFGCNRYNGENKKLTITDVENAIYKGMTALRNMKDENGEVMGYNADTIIIPGNMPLLEKYVKQVIGSQYDPTGMGNGINVSYGNWKLVILPSWQYEISEDEAAQTYPIIVMSSEANRALCGNMFFNRIPLSIKNWEDPHTRNWIWNGYCRFSIGFATYKHVVLVESYSSEETGDQTQI